MGEDPTSNLDFNSIQYVLTHTQDSQYQSTLLIQDPLPKTTM